MMATGAFVTLAAMTKFTGFLVVLPILIVLIVDSESVYSFLRSTGVLISSGVVTVLVFLLAGYNALAQWLYTAYKTTLYKLHKAGAGGRSAGSPADVMNNDLTAFVGTLYNARWMNVVFLVLAAAFVGTILYDRSSLQQRRHVVSAASLTAFLPFAVFVIFSAGTLSRHTIVLLAPLGFIALSGLSIAIDRSDVSQHWLVRFCQISLLVSGVQFLIWL
jgi:4-amino-4-deoxy-L-arabinose transferase-like glycosyltransferase